MEMAVNYKKSLGPIVGFGNPLMLDSEPIKTLKIVRTRFQAEQCSLGGTTTRWIEREFVLVLIPERPVDIISESIQQIMFAPI
jgi:hypothetical protein